MEGAARKWSRSMAIIIQFYVPRRFHKKLRWIPLDLRGRVIEFPLRVRKTA
jgi:hypothetical protein